MKKFIGILALVSFVAAIYFGIRDLVSLFIIIPLSLLCLSGFEKVGSTVSFCGVIVVCIGSILWVNSQSPLWGERYEQEEQYKAIKQQVRHEENKNTSKSLSARAYVEKIMKDPDSAKFSGEYVSGKGSVCGYVNGKNSFGAYTGNKKYVVIGTTAYLDDGGSEFSPLWQENCL
ncbi:hypothetical protein RJE46_13980 [Cedecea neteri]|uniref:hypothetical protein n=1 Tax=Cedecea neteri TaxID=158822 RepID=UPI002892CE8B|nr:hypothetical protein [Cedecea neteri]WNJ77742.1 hypothetical protein RJE46_13980 [Cedecea neteri]